MSPMPMSKNRSLLHLRAFGCLLTPMADGGLAPADIAAYLSLAVRYSRSWTQAAGGPSAGGE